MPTALVMEGGAMRGLFTCGVTDVLQENGITFDGAAGISAGAAFGCNVKSHQPGRARRYNERYCRDPRYAGVHSLLITGDLFGVDFCYRELPLVLDPFDAAAFARDPMPFYVGATDVETGEPVYHLCTDGGVEDLLWIRASASMPLVSRVVELEGRKLLDGGIADPIPLRFMLERGYDRAVVILTQPLGYVKAPSPSLPAFRVAMRRYPALVRAMAVRHEVYNAQTAQVRACEEAGTAFVLRPPEKLPVGHMEKDPARLERAYQTGRREMERRLAELKAFLRGS